MPTPPHPQSRGPGPRPLIALLLFSTLALGRTAEPEAVVPPPSAAWRTLFNGRDLSGWDVYLSSPDGKGPLTPNVDPKGVFRVVPLDGENVVRVSGEIYGAITTREEFGNMHFRVDFQWGVKRWPPRAHVGRDSGILYACVGNPNPGTGWMTSVENNIMEKGVGQWWSVNGAIIDVEGEWITPANELFVPYKKEGDGERNIVYQPGAPRLTATSANGITPAIDLEKVFGEWNTVEVVFWGGVCIHLLNGHVNLVAINPRYQDGQTWRPLARGRIQLQSEAAELFYRKAEVRSLSALPTELLDVVPSPFGDESGFEPLLAPAALGHWKQSGPGRFQVREGIASAEGGMGLWWYSARPYTNFVLRGEFLQTAVTADSGIFVRFPNPGNDPWNAVKQGHEIEIGDPNPETPTWRTGSIYPFQASLTANTRPPGEWNQYEIVCRDHDYSVRINGRVVTTWTDPQRRSAAGYLGLQNYEDGSVVRHRNLRIRELW